MATWATASSHSRGVSPRLMPRSNSSTSGGISANNGSSASFNNSSRATSASRRSTAPRRQQPARRICAFDPTSSARSLALIIHQRPGGWVGSNTPPAVDFDDIAGQKFSILRRQEQRRVGNILHPRQAAERHAGDEFFALAGL